MSPIADYGQVIVHRKNRDFLLKIRAGEFEFNELMSMIENKMEKMKAVYESSDLPKKTDEQKAQQILIEIRDRFYI